MKIRKAYKFRLKTNNAIDQKFWLFAGHCRFVWNYFWQINQNRLSQGQKIMRYNEMDYWSKFLKDSDKYNFLAEAQAHIIQQKLKDLDKAYMDAFDKKQPNKRMPKKRKKQLHSSFRFPQAQHFEIDNRRVKLPKIGWVGFHKSQEIVGKPKNITISHKSGHWYMSVQVEVEVTQRDIANDTAIGIDVGIANFATCATVNSDCIYEPKNSFRSIETKLAKEQRKLKNKKKFSNNWVKQTKKIQNIHSKAANIRNDHLHKVSTEICKNHAMIFIEDLKISNMSKSAKGTQEQHGKNVKAKSGLNKSILDQGWYKFRNQLEYKSHWQGGVVVAVEPRYTSQTCSNCGNKAKESRLTQSSFVCVSCGFEANADVNAARNVLAAGLSRVGLCSELH
jgi:putative transposase